MGGERGYIVKVKNGVLTNAVCDNRVFIMHPTILKNRNRYIPSRDEESAGLLVGFKAFSSCTHTTRGQR